MRRFERLSDWLTTSAVCFFGVSIGWIIFHFATDFQYLLGPASPLLLAVLNGVVLVVVSLGLGMVVSWIRRKEG